MTAAAPAALRFAFRDEPGFVDLVTHRLAADRYELDLEVPDMRCANCATRIEAALTPLDGVAAVRINPARQLVALEYDPSRIGLGALLDAISAAGYTPVFVARSADDPALVAERRAQLKRLGVAGIAMMQVMMLALPLYVADRDHMSAFYQALFRWSALICTAPAVFYCARPFFRNAIIALRTSTHGLAMDVPIALAITIAYAASVLSTVAGHGDVYYDSVTMFVFLLLGARYLEQRTRHRLARFDDWRSLLPAAASRIGSDGVETIPCSAIRPGDRIHVASGTRIPIDGVIADGATQIDESLLTGESRLIEKSAGQRVFAGTLNVARPIHVIAQTQPARTRLAEIHRLALRATLDKPPVALLADRVARHFVAGILLLACVTYLAWYVIDAPRALPAAIAVLVVACPCALSLAVPTALTAAATALRRHGFVATRAHVIERLARVSHVVFDKTGTLTGGRAELIAVKTLGAASVNACIEIARALESGGIHPLGAAFDATAAPRHPAHDVRIEPGKGIEGRVDGVAYRLGNAEFCAIDARASQPELTTFYLARIAAPTAAPTALAEFGVRLALRDDAKATLAALTELGVSAEILTGDAVEPARLLARELADLPFTAAANPQAKLAHILALRERGVDVAMVGDGVNDVPGLAAAAVSITTADGADLAKSHSDAILLTAGIGGISHAIRIARRARSIIRENLWWAAVYNLIAIPLAGAGLVPPWLAAVGMSASSLGVTLNAMRLAIPDRRPDQRERA